MISSDMQINGWKRLLPASLSKMRCALSARMGNIAGSWTAECRSEMKMETSSSGMGSRPTSTDRKRAEDTIREQETELRQMLDFTPQLVAVFGPNGERLYANRICARLPWHLLLKSGGKHSGIFFRPGRLFILMTGNGRRALIPIVLAPVGPLTSWSCVCAKGTELIAGFWLVTIQCATTRDRLRDGMWPAPTSKTASRRKTGFAAKTSLCVKKSTKPRCLKRSLEHLPL